MIALALLLATSGCSTVRRTEERGAGIDLRGTWVLVSGDGADGPLAVTPDTHVTLAFDRDSMGGKGPCNDYGADYELVGNSFDVPGPGIEQTLMGCGDEPDALESAYLTALTEVDTVARDGDTLMMTGAGVELGFRLDEPWPRGELVGRRWRLVRWTDDSGVHHRPSWEPGLRPFIRFSDRGGSGGSVSASSGCRVLEGRWRLWRGAPRLTGTGWRGDCPDPLAQQDMAVNNAMSEPVLEVRDRAGHAELVLR